MGMGGPGHFPPMSGPMGGMLMGGPPFGGDRGGFPDRGGFQGPMHIGGAGNGGVWPHGMMPPGSGGGGGGLGFGFNDGALQLILLVPALLGAGQARGFICHTLVGQHAYVVQLQYDKGRRQD